jgi:hypothetical protein
VIACLTFEKGQVRVANFSQPTMTLPVSWIDTDANVHEYLGVTYAELIFTVETRYGASSL